MYKYWGKSSCLQNMSEHVLLQLHNCLLQCLHKVNNTQTLNVVLVLLSTSARAFWFCILSLWMPEHKWMQLDKLVYWLLCTSVLESDWLEKRSHYGAANQSSPHNATFFPLQLNMYRLTLKNWVCVCKYKEIECVEYYYFNSFNCTISFCNVYRTSLISTTLTPSTTQFLFAKFTENVLFQLH